ncbi:PLP-dependent aminotransferase family protein [Actinoplanes sp. NBRC 101535]|uniref:aminotransferase-like domain-containing protein n=1 Tax=Actinoplanes sp. NBRC 101535 TaxID=3032196 RepID=UPI0024A142F0|nr:PLP-dependent aminotransferase family protein [Actinoplanes sp. NBRC 101535]GLY08114.1 aminotransferase [Actinoplanes sp. NBRC 101535]
MTELSALARGLSAPRGFVNAGMAVPAPGAIHLVGGIPAPEALPVAAMASASAALWSDPVAATASLQYSPAPGSAVLRSWIAEREGVDPARIVITNGGMHGLMLAVLTVVDRDATVAVDDPVFPGFLWALEITTRRILPVPVDDEGLDVDHLAARLAAGERIAAAYTVPTFHNPAQATLSAQRRHALVALADRYGFHVILDDPYRELRFAGTDPGTAMLHASDRTIHVNSFTKTLGPGLRLGWLVLPDHLVDPVVRLRNRLDVHTGAVTQALVERLVTSGDGWYDRLIRDAVALYRERAAVLRDHLPDSLETRAPDGGLFLWARLTDDRLDPADVFRRAAAAGVVYQPGEFFAADPKQPGRSARYLRFAYGDRTPAELYEAARRLARAI